jgi:phosphoenolpyruvate carboxykinase (diphosphate)
VEVTVFMSIDWKSLGDSWLVEDPTHALGWHDSLDSKQSKSKRQLQDYLNLKLAVMGLAIPAAEVSTLWGGQLLSNLRENNRLLGSHRAGIDVRIEDFLASYLNGVYHYGRPTLPRPTLVLDWHGLARELSLPASEDSFSNELLTSYRLHNGVLHNPKADRRTTQGTFHVADGGLPIPADKLQVPRAVFANLFWHAVNPPDDFLRLPYCNGLEGESRTFVSLLVRPLVCPAVSNYCRHKTMEVRFFAPGGLVSNLDFVESIFGNGGDPLLPDNDAGLDCLHWSGHTGCVILAPHLCKLTKQQLGLPNWDSANERQRRDGMCWKEPNELYNGGSAFKVTCRDARGVIVTIIADNYFGYCKKEVKTQISYAANLMGNVEEEHAGGTLAFPSWSLGDEFQLNSTRYNGRTFANLAEDYQDFIDVKPEGYGVDKNCESLIYVPENALASLNTQSMQWTDANGNQQSIRIEVNKVYMSPAGYKIRMDKHPSAPSWRLIGSSSEGIVCHKPCTVSGGGKSEISKSLRDYMLSGPLFVNDIESDFAKLDEIFSKDYSQRWHTDSSERPNYAEAGSRPVLDPRRTLGSVIKLLTTSKEYTDDYNKWLKEIPSYIYAMAFIIKRFSKPEWQGNWRQHFGVDVVNGHPGHELKFDNRKLVGMYLRVGVDSEGRWQIFKLRQDFAAAQKIQLEDDITASVVVPNSFLKSAGVVTGTEKASSQKFVSNCEYRLFQRPDDAIHRGLDKQTEADMAQLNNFFCNYEPLDQKQAMDLITDVINFEQYTAPMQDMLKEAVETKSAFVVSSAHPRLVDGVATKNPRYLQDRTDLKNPRERYIAMQGVRLYRCLGAKEPVHHPVTSVLSGRRNNPPEPARGIRSLAVYNPIHYQELPELFMDYVCSLTGKSPSTTGAGSEGALTKGPFNALLPVHDLNACMTSMILTGLGGFSTAAGHVGSYMEVGHDISFLAPELWCRLSAEERDPNYLIREKLLEKIEDMQHQGRTVLSSRLGYRITARFVRRFFGRMFDNPDRVFTVGMLCPEQQDMDGFADGVDHIVEAQQRVAEQYFKDGSYEFAIPPLQAVLSVMAKGSWDGKLLSDPEVRKLFTYESMINSRWYRSRLEAKKAVDKRLWAQHLAYLRRFTDETGNGNITQRIDLGARLQQAIGRLKYLETDAYWQRIQGTIGADPALALI